MRVMTGYFVKVHRRRGLMGNVRKGERISMKYQGHVLEFLLEGLRTDGVECF